MDWAVQQEISSTEVCSALDSAVEIARSNLATFGNQFWAATSINSRFPPSPNTDWTTGFCTGEYWLAYEYTKDDAFKQTALHHVDSFLERIEKRIQVDHHDMGFLYTPSCVAAYQLTDSQAGRRAALLAADNLAARFQEKGEFLQAWGPMGARANYRLIIDCLLNLPLLFWASDQSGNPVYKDYATRHLHTALRHLVRPDFSTYHTFFFDPETGAPQKGVTAQGYRDDSAWARGQAWGIYGLALCYRYTGLSEILPLYQHITNFFCERLPDDLVPFWDLDFTAADHEPRDSSAAAIAACGMMEMSRYLPAEDAAFHQRLARQLAKALWDTCAVRTPNESNGLLLHGVYAKKSPYNTVTDSGVDECNTWGDYFWMELLMRLHKDWNAYW